MFTIWKKIGSGWGSINVSCQLTPPRPSKKGSKRPIGRRSVAGSRTSRRDGFLRHFPLFYLRYDGAEMTGN